MKVRVRCIDTKSRFGGNDLDLTLNKEYEVIKLDDDGTVCIVDDSDSPSYYFDDRFEIIKGDKMDQVRKLEEEGKLRINKSSKIYSGEGYTETRIVRKLEDLDGLENGMGAFVEIKHNVANVLCKNKEIFILIINSSNEYSDVETFLKTLKAMGFKFELKKLRAIEEVLEDMKENSLNPYNDYNYFLFEVVYDKFSKDYGINDVDSRFALGAYIFSQETAQKYADELNEIMRGGK